MSQNINDILLAENVYILSPTLQQWSTKNRRMINLLAHINDLILGVTCVFCSYREESYKTVILHSDPGDPQPPTFNHRFKMFTAIYKISCHNKPCSAYVAIDFTLHDSGVSWLLFVYYLPCHIENSYLFGTSQPSAFVCVYVIFTSET